MIDEQLYTMHKSRTPYKDPSTGLWVVRWERYGKWKSESFVSDTDAWVFYYNCVQELKQQFKQERSK